MVDPTPDEAARMISMQAVFTWAGFGTEDMTSDKTRAGTLALLLGIKPDTHPRVMCLLEEADALTVISKWKVANPGANPADVSYLPPTLAELGMAKLVLRACRIVSGYEMTVADMKKQVADANAMAAMAKAASTSTTSAASERKIKLSSILSQVDDTETTVMSEKDLVAAYLRYSTVFGDNERPPKESEPTSEQLSAIFHLVNQNNVPYCDFSVFGPYGHRMIKKIKLSGYVIGRDGTLQNVELTGPTNVNMWLQSWQVFSNACVMLDIIDLGVLNKYRDLIEKYHNRYGVAIWALLYQADVRCRLELFERVRRQIMAEQESLVKAHGAAAGPPPTVAGFDPKRPWNLVLQRAINNEEYWREEVVEPSMMVLTKVSGLGDVVDGDAKVRQDGSMASALAPNPGAAPSRLGDAAPKIRPRNPNRTGRHHQVENGRYTSNRTGYALCDAYNEGRCDNTVSGGWCPVNWDRVHQCYKCLSQHPASRCPHETMPTPNFLKPKKGKGKGGRKGKGKQAQY